MWDWINGKTEDFEKGLIDRGNQELTKPIVAGLKELGIDTWEWFVEVLPDIAGFGVIAAGAFVILGSMVGKGGMMKPLAILSGGLILSMCILMTN